LAAGLSVLACVAPLVFVALMFANRDRSCPTACNRPPVAIGDALPGPVPGRPATRADRSRKTEPVHRSRPKKPAQPPKQPAEPAPVATPAPRATDVSGAADYVRAFYADLSNGDYKAAWPLLAADLRAHHGSFESWKKGFDTTVSQAAQDIAAKPAGDNAATVSLTLTAVDKDACKREVTRRFAVTWRLERENVWRAVHAEARPLTQSPTAVVASC
jgi:hypothetical protein